MTDGLRRINAQARRPLQQAGPPPGRAPRAGRPGACIRGNRLAGEEPVEFFHSADVPELQRFAFIDDGAALLLQYSQDCMGLAPIPSAHVSLAVRGGCIIAAPRSIIHVRRALLTFAGVFSRRGWPCPGSRSICLASFARSRGWVLSKRIRRARRARQLMAYANAQPKAPGKQ